MNKEEEDKSPEVLVRDAKVLVWGPIYVTLNLEKSQNSSSDEVVEETPAEISSKNIIIEKQETPQEEPKETINPANSKRKNQVNILTAVSSTPAPAITPIPKPNGDGTKKVTYVYNLVDHGLDCECIDVKGELLIRSALPVYRKISQGIEFEQITTNQIKLIITSRVLENYQEVFQGFTIPKATFRIWILGYKF